MPIVVNLDVMMARRKIRSKELAEKIGITEANLSILKTGKAKAIRFTTLTAICEVLNCQPGDILVYEAEVSEEELVPLRRRKHKCVGVSKVSSQRESAKIVEKASKRQYIAACSLVCYRTCPAGKKYSTISRQRASARRSAPRVQCRLESWPAP